MIPRIAVFGGDKNLQILQQLPGVELQQYYCDTRDYKSLTHSIGARKFDLVGMLTRWMNHSHYKSIVGSCKDNEITCLTWAKGVSQLVADLNNRYELDAPVVETIEPEVLMEDSTVTTTEQLTAAAEQQPTQSITPQKVLDVLEMEPGRSWDVYEMTKFLDAEPRRAPEVNRIFSKLLDRKQVVITSGNGTREGVTVSPVVAAPVAAPVVAAPVAAPVVPPPRINYVGEVFPWMVVTSAGAVVGFQTLEAALGKIQTDNGGQLLQRRKVKMRMELED